MMPNVNRVVMLPAELYRLTMQYAERHEVSWNDAVRLLVEQALGEDGGEDLQPVCSVLVLESELYVCYTGNVHIKQAEPTKENK